MASHTRAASPTPTPEHRDRLGRRAQLLAAASVAYNVLEAGIAVTAGVVAGSVALMGFGLDSVVEVSSGLIILWQFKHQLPETRERQALRLMAFAFFALAAYVTVESVHGLAGGRQAAPSAVGIGLAVASLIIMPFLSWAQRRTGNALGSATVVADSTQTLLCTYLSAVLLIGLVLNATVGWSWADPIAGLVIAAVAVREGREAWRGDSCCAPLGIEPPDNHEDPDGARDRETGCADDCCGPGHPAARVGTAEIRASAGGFPARAAARRGQRVIFADDRHPDAMAETKRIVYDGSGPLLRALIQMFDEEGVTVTVRREGPPETEYRDTRGMAENVVATLTATGAAAAIKSAVAAFRERHGRRGRVRIEGEDDDQPPLRGRHRA
jgi:hypothetical protein